MVIVSDQRMGGPGIPGPPPSDSNCHGPPAGRGPHHTRPTTNAGPHNTHGAMPTRCPSYFGVGQRRVSAPPCARRGTTPPSIPPGSSGLLPPTDGNVSPIPSYNRFALHGLVT